MVNSIYGNLYQRGDCIYRLYFCLDMTGNDLRRSLMKCFVHVIEPINKRTNNQMLTSQAICLCKKKRFTMLILMSVL